MASTTRQALLQALSAAEGAYISGQQLAQQLGVSRAAVHKAAAALTAQGYALEAASRRGYRLLGGDPFCTEAVGPYPAPVQLYDTLESTNRTAKLLALEGAAHGTLVLAGGQTAGRGRLGRSFASPAGKGVYCSVVLRPPLPAANAQTATIGAAVAVCRAVQMLCGLELAIKWVNDLYYKGKKVCGILTEAGTDLESGQLEWLVVGIGLNLTATAEDFPPELAAKAGSLYPGGPAPGHKPYILKKEEHKHEETTYQLVADAGHAAVPHARHGRDGQRGRRYILYAGGNQELCYVCDLSPFVRFKRSQADGRHRLHSGH